MPAGAATTNKTQFMRYLNDHETEIPSLKKFVVEYRSHRISRNAFGFWLRWKYLPDFDKVYAGWWLKRPELH